MDKNQARAAVLPGFDPYVGHSDTGGFFSSIAHAVSKAAHGIGSGVSRGLHDVTHPKDLAKDSFSVAKYSYKNVVKPAVAKGLPIVQTVLKNAGPVGMVASGAIGAMKAGLTGKNLESIAWAAAEGAAPSGIDRAISAAEAIRHGKNVVGVAINEGVSHFVPGSPEHLGFSTAINVLKTSASKAAMGVARRALPSEGARRAFDTAVGVASQAVQANGLSTRALSLPTLNMAKPRGVLSAMTPNLKGAVDSLMRNPSLASTDPLLLAQQFRTSVATVNDALRRVQRVNTLPWRSLSPHATSFVRKYVPHAPLLCLRHAHTDTGGLDSSGTKYIVVKGDSPWTIAQKLTGNGANWTQLKALNTDKKPTIDKNVWVGEILNIPASWQRPNSTPAGATSPSLPAVPKPSIGPVSSGPAPSIDITPSIVQAKAILAAWGKTDGVNQAGLTDYGSNVADLSTSMGPRDIMQLASYQAWANKTMSAGLNTTGALDAASLASLQSWAESRASSAIPTGTARFPDVTTLPAVVITGSAPPAPPPPGVPALPSGGSPLPTVAPANQPTTPGKVAAQSQGKSSLGMMAAGAIAGGLLFGPPGALIGAAGGAAIS